MAITSLPLPDSVPKLRVQNMTARRSGCSAALFVGEMDRSYPNQSEHDALNRSVSMTDFRTVTLRGLQLIDALLEALSTLPKTGTLPLLLKTPLDG